MPPPPATDDRELAVEAREVLGLRRTLDEILAIHTGQSIEKISKDTDRDFIMTSEAAKEYGIIDEVISTRGVPKQLAAAGTPSS